MENKMYLVKRISKKEGREDFAYVQLYADLGYTNLVISMDKNNIAEFLNMPVGQLFAIEKDTPLLVGSFKPSLKGND